MATQSADEPASGLAPTESKPTKLLGRVGRFWRQAAERRSPAAASPGASAPPARAGAGYASRVEALEVRMEHLEAALEGLQDALYRQAVLGDKRADELRRRTEPDEMARELGRDARRRGL
jgi:uncharacterized coiled-coil protein SlyX